jgi:ribulose-5-phosphate 4-epimerase/fuculose-1-phosphate aldolase
MSESDELRARVAQSCRVLGGLGLAKGATGHSSARLPGTNRIFIRARGPGELGVRFTTPDQVIEVDLDGKPVQKNDKGLEAPMEVFIHTSIYKARPEVNAVVHVHPLPVVLFTITRKTLLPLYGAYDPASAKLAIKGIPTYPRSILCDTPERGDELAAAMGQSDCCMMRGHGISTAGVNVEEASLTAIHLTNLAEVNYQANLLGDPHPIPQDEQDFVMAIDSKAPNSSPGALPVGRNAALWRYYCSLAEGTAG